MEVYLDNSATTRPYEAVTDEVCRVMNECYGNPSSLHRMGKAAEDRLIAARNTIARTLDCLPKEITFTSGGTESDNLAIIGYAMANRRNGMRLVTQKTEHMAVLEAFKYLEQQGFEVYYAGVDKYGAADCEDIKSHITDDTILVSVMHVNNENGAIMPLENISAAIDRKKCAFHVDAVQSYGKIPVNIKRNKIDMLSISSHKIHGPNGAGALYVRSGIRLNPVLLGGKQENGMRSGTENLAGICGFAKAAEIKFADMAETAEHISGLKKYLADGLTKNIENVTVNSGEDSIYCILNVSFPGVKSEVLLHVLESKGIYVSTGSACNSKKKLNYVLKAMGLNDNITDSAVRFSFSGFNTKEEIDYVIAVLADEIPKLRKIMR